MPIITLLTDFGATDSYVAQMKGVILQTCRDVDIVDISHDIPPQDIFRAAYVLADSYPSFPRDTIHVVVVDPGVGSERRVLCLAAARHLFLAPDNGVLEFVLRGEHNDGLVAVTSEWYFGKSVSNTFHGRDIFASVAGHLALGVKLARLGPNVADPVRVELPEVSVSEDKLSGAVIHVDRFGNLITNIGKAHLAGIFRGAKSSQFLTVVADQHIRGLSRAYVDVGSGELLVLMGSSGRLEVALCGGSAAGKLKVSRGEPVEVVRL